jgi:hypothetical protein
MKFLYNVTAVDSLFWSYPKWQQVFIDTAATLGLAWRREPALWCSRTLHPQTVRSKDGVPGRQLLPTNYLEQAELTRDRSNVSQLCTVRHTVLFWCAGMCGNVLILIQANNRLNRFLEGKYCPCLLYTYPIYDFYSNSQKLRKVTISFVISVRLSVCPHGTTRLPQEGFSWNLMYGYFSKNC